MLMDPRNNKDPLLEEVSTSVGGEEVDPWILDLAMNIAKKIFIKMKEDEDKNKLEEEEARRKAKEEEKGRKKLEYNDDFVELLVSKIMKRVSLNTKESSTKSKGNEFHKVQFDYSCNFMPNFSLVPLRKLPTLNELSYDEWVDKMKSHLIGVHHRLWEILNVGVSKPTENEEMTPKIMQDLHRYTQAVSIIKGSLSMEEYHKVQGRNDVHVIWSIQRRS